MLTNCVVENDSDGGAGRLLAATESSRMIIKDNALPEALTIFENSTASRSGDLQQDNNYNWWEAEPVRGAKTA